MNFVPKCLLASLLIMPGVSAVQAGIIIGGTRLIFDGSKKEAALNVKNPDDSPYLVHSWIDALSDSAQKPPFIITPPLYRLDKGQQNVERIVLTGALPQNRETLFWLNIKSIPSATTAENSLQIAVKTRIKLIYRPTSLKRSTPEEQADKLIWRRNGNKIEITNPTDYVMNFNEIIVGGKKVPEVTWILPHAQAAISLPEQTTTGAVIFKLINDYGGTGEAHTANL
ncbi:fimbria/pilus periplasmic chaperone [Leclercia adecarboxylata]|uniref:fimbrial biogenesis chaperone n=1 Tax=Leclercia adecarboxylata TaxID=83655 RepID=UPI002DBA2E5C|nr:fimbria/pilus periplasmic chaperone [Leclercia adecarboxylata]MEB6377365.1 fimbria/pilus periplasmic chaperone [Leclercia adecarboxylata]